MAEISCIKTHVDPQAVGVEVLHVDDTVGRGLFATQSFTEDQVVLEEEPFASCQFLYNKEYGYLACDECLRSLESAECNARRLTQDKDLKLPHSECGVAPPSPLHYCPHCQDVYCSESCLTSAWLNHHKTLCTRSNPAHPLVKLQQEWKNHHYPPETMSIMLVARLLAKVLQSDDTGAANAKLAEFCHVTRDLTATVSHKLLGDSFAAHIDTLRQLMDQAIGAPQIAQWLTTDGFTSLLALVGSNGQGIGSSTLGLWVAACEDITLPGQERQRIEDFIDHLYEKMEETVGSFLNCEGSGVFALQSRINHSCRPNATVSFPHNCHRLCLTATEIILPGQQIFISYLDACQIQSSRHSRHKLLSENYVFVCACERCDEESGDPDVTSDEEDLSDDDEDNKSDDMNG